MSKDGLNYLPEWYVGEVQEDTDKLKKFNNLLKKYPGKVLTVYYEDIVGTTEGEVGGLTKLGGYNFICNAKSFVDPFENNRICNFLEVKKFPMYSMTYKKNTNELSYYINNLDTVFKLFKDKNIIFKVGTHEKNR